MAHTESKKHKTKQQRALEAIGLGENETRLYLLMLKRPKATVQELQKRSSFPRTMLYYVLRNLQEAGLVLSVKEGWRTEYIAQNPEHLYDVLDARQREFADRIADVQSLVPSLRQVYRLADRRPDVRFFEGLEQYKAALDDVFDSGADCLYAYVPSNRKKRPGLALRQAFDEKRIEKGIAQKILVPDDETANVLAAQYDHDRLTEIRVMKDDRQDDFDMRLYNSKIVYSRFTAREPIVTLIDDRPFYEMQKTLFLLAWK
ncbi:MAG: hypothetical protein COU35_03275 [Candidatus Magasanikbacteria bacterium CG10_big_fil_rev_8_21_14_0_10_47_10]|uniref:Transcription regulator TrmB N-terminal domain-containing protein n=1 Tax=Candidatus Magasanikbacteria bacterium CG10_big_fil_rev_8_21_14_0_10_47_10 TaxID=1974652 RepID=A0A2H0TQ57_9BACT|nr:MAG: hypothetical protein COU35_03275 [Candidatus Magasanikbacteria bacterium CG10_big_fil_rev_8_21_14_0_10_47_10]